LYLRCFAVFFFDTITAITSNEAGLVYAVVVAAVYRLHDTGEGRRDEGIADAGRHDPEGEKQGDCGR